MRCSNVAAISIIAAVIATFLSAPVDAQAAFKIRIDSVAWEQTASARSFMVFMEREELSALDRVSRMVFAAQTGKSGPGLETLSVNWQVKQGEALIGQNTAPITNGLLSVSFSLTGLKPGRYDISAELKQLGQVLEKGQTFFRVVETAAPAQQGRIAVNLPRGIALKNGSYPVNFGVPFPKGALWNEKNARIVKGDGTPVPAQMTVRSRWGHTDETSVRWLGIDFQAENALPWWPDRKDTRYFLEYGPQGKPADTREKVTITDTSQGLEVYTGPLRFLVNKTGFNLIDDVKLNGKPVLKSSSRAGLYLIDHEGTIYRAANDRDVKLSIEEQGDLRAVIRAEGWYVKDGSAGNLISYTLPTDKLCKFITRIEVYAGKPYVRVLNTWILTFDSFSVRLKDVGLSLPLQNATRAEFGVEGEKSLKIGVPPGGVYLIQHLPDAFSVEAGGGEFSKDQPGGKHSAGWIMADDENGIIGIGLRDIWQRFPKELEIMPGELKLHIWPAHGKTHANINAYAHEQINRLWFAHQGQELNLAQPWQYYFSVAQIAHDPSIGIYKAAGIALAGIHASAMGTAITSDMLIQFADPAHAATMRDTANCFQAAPHALADPAWACASLAIGYLHPYDPARMAVAEEAISGTMRAYWEIQDTCGEYGMWLYRPWHHSQLREKGKLEPYRLHNATHHYDAFMPWMLYARSGDPFYLTQGAANMRLLTDVQVIHYDDPTYPQREFHGGQGRLVGSTRHTNGFNTWGGDHAILAHLTCYNSMLLAYYLTGDLRLREVVVDEWQKTLVNERKNPEYAKYLKADRVASVDGGTMTMESGSARDVNNALGELMDLYQLTYEPRLLALMAPMMDFFLNKFMRPWGQAVHNVILFYGSQQAKKQLLDGVDEYRKTKGKLADPKCLWQTYAPFDNFALAAIINSNSGAHVDAWLAAEVPVIADRVHKMSVQSQNCVTFCTVPDWIVYMPRVMYAAARSGGDVPLNQIVALQAMPIGGGSGGGWVRCIVSKDKSEPFAISILGKVGQGGFPVTVFGPDNKLLMETLVPEGMHFPHTIKISDGRIGQFVIFIKARDAQDTLFMPLTNLPEVYYYRSSESYWAQHQMARFFTRSAGDIPVSIAIQPHGSDCEGRIVTDDHKLLAATSKGEVMKTDVGPDGAWIITNGRYVKVLGPVTIAVGRDRWFAPDQDKLDLTP